MERFKSIALVLFVVVFIAALCFKLHHRTTKQDDVYRDTIRTTVIDTISFYKPVPRDSVVIRYITVRLPIGDDKEDNFPTKDHFEDKGEMVAHLTNEASKTDSADVVVPITQKIYEDSTYRAYVSGYRASLDSVIFYPRQETTTIITKCTKKRWNIGVHTGYGVTSNGSLRFAPYIGVGVSYSFFRF